MLFIVNTELIYRNEAKHVETPALEHNITIISAIASVATLVGLLGTVQPGVQGGSKVNVQYTLPIKFDLGL